MYARSTHLKMAECLREAKKYLSKNPNQLSVFTYVCLDVQKNRQ